jgi:hypothetical protein
MKKFMVIHKAPGLDWSVVEENWRKLANVESATWIKTYFNVKEGVRCCVWISENAEDLSKIFDDLEISYETIIEVHETTPDLWGDRWEEHLAAEEAADTLGF